MYFEPVTGNLESNSPNDVAKFIHSFFQYQYEVAIKNDILTHQEYEAAIRTNRLVHEQYKNDPDIVGWGGGPKDPYNERQLISLQTIANNASIQKKEAKILLDFVIERFIENIK
jgi:hypothetical protein